MIFSLPLVESVAVPQPLPFSFRSDWTKNASGTKKCKPSVLNWNQSSIGIHKSFGAFDVTLAEGWHAFRLKREEMVKFVSK